VSVINKMLRDLDDRAASHGDKATQSDGAPAPLTRGTSSVPRPGAAPTGRKAPAWHRGIWLMVSLALLVGAIFLWQLRADGPGPREAADLALVRPDLVSAPEVGSSAAMGEQTGTAASAAVPAEPAPTLRLPQPVVGTGQVVVGATPAASTPVRELPVIANRTDKPREIARPAAPVRAPVTARVPSREMASPPDARPVVSVPTRAAEVEPARAVNRPVAAASRNEPAALTPLPAVRWQDAAGEVLAQAQQMWASGAREAATNVLRQGLAAQGPAPMNATPGSRTVALAMVRELVRMELALGHDDQVLALLRRQEDLMQAQSDLWAVRAHAAQRLGQHGEAAQSYQNALRLRPREPRWLLGAAVSLAAQGQTSAAAVLVEQARDLQTVQPDILAYLRQLGVPLKDR